MSNEWIFREGEVSEGSGPLPSLAGGCCDCAVLTRSGDYRQEYLPSGSLRATRGSPGMSRLVPEACLSIRTLMALSLTLGLRLRTVSDPPSLTRGPRVTSVLTAESVGSGKSACARVCV